MESTYSWLSRLYLEWVDYTMNSILQKVLRFSKVELSRLNDSWVDYMCTDESTQLKS